MKLVRRLFVQAPPPSLTHSIGTGIDVYGLVLLTEDSQDPIVWTFTIDGIDPTPEMYYPSSLSSHPQLWSYSDLQPGTHNLQIVNDNDLPSIVLWLDYFVATLDTDSLDNGTTTAVETTVTPVGGGSIKATQSNPQPTPKRTSTSQSSPVVTRPGSTIQSSPMTSNTSPMSTASRLNSLSTTTSTENPSLSDTSSSSSRSNLPGTVQIPATTNSATPVSLPAPQVIAKEWGLSVPSIMGGIAAGVVLLVVTTFIYVLRPRRLWQHCRSEIASRCPRSVKRDSLQRLRRARRIPTYGENQRECLFRSG